MTLRTLSASLRLTCYQTVPNFVIRTYAGQAQVDAHSILLTFCAFIYVSFPFGVSTAATIRVGNLVGANRPSEARLAGVSPSDLHSRTTAPGKFRQII